MFTGREENLKVFLALLPLSLRELEIVQSLIAKLWPSNLQGNFGNLFKERYIGFNNRELKVKEIKRSYRSNMRSMLLDNTQENKKQLAVGSFEKLRLRYKNILFKLKEELVNEY